jgi:aspartate carbamoyltransferase regulatory subunit
MSLNCQNNAPSGQTHYARIVKTHGRVRTTSRVTKLSSVSPVVTEDQLSACEVATIVRPSTEKAELTP